MTAKLPRLTIGLPVYNGERYLRQAIDSILAQTFTDFELIISDNASEDATVSILEAYASTDARIRLVKNPVNRGAAWNYNYVFSLARAAYFKWAAHDDVLAPTFLEKCAAALDHDPTAVLAHTKTYKIDETGQVVDTYETRMDTSGAFASQRFHDLVLTRHPCTAVFGVIRTAVLARTPLIGSYVGSDRVLLAELGLHGRILELPEYLFSRRDHAEASIRRYNAYDRQAWFDQKGGRRLTLPTWRVGWEYFRAVNRAPLGAGERLACYRLLAFWLRWDREHLQQDLRVARKRFLKPKVKHYESCNSGRWVRIATGRGDRDPAKTHGRNRRTANVMAHHALLLLLRL